MAGNRLPTLKNRRDFLRLQKGRRFAVPGLVLQAAPRSGADAQNKDGQDTDTRNKNEKGCDERGTASQAHGTGGTVAPMPLRVGFTVTKKIGNAVVRNRARRRLRAAADRVLPSTGRDGWDYVLIGRAETPTRPFALLCEDLQRAVAAVHEGRRQDRRGGRGARRGRGKPARRAPGGADAGGALGPE